MNLRGVAPTAPSYYAAVIVSVLAFSCEGGSSGPVSGAEAMAHVEVMVKHGPRPSGSDALKETQAYLIAQIEQLGLQPQVQEWEDPVANVAFKNIWTEIPGADPQGPILILAAHYDTKLSEDIEFVGAIDGAGAPSVLLELAQHLQTRENYPNVWLVFFDGEESIPWDWDDDLSLFGSKHFVAEMKKDKERFPRSVSSRVKALVLLDLIGSKNQKIDRDAASARQLSDIFLEAAQAMGEEERMYAFQSEMKDDHVPFKEGAGIAVIDLIDFVQRVPGGVADPDYEQWWHTADDTVDAMHPDSLEFVGNLVWYALPILEEKVFGKGK